MFDLTPAVTSGMTESYSKPVDIVVWDEDMMRHVVLMTRGEGVGWHRNCGTPQTYPYSDSYPQIGACPPDLELDAELIEGASGQALRGSIVTTKDGAIEIGVLLLHGPHGAPQDPSPRHRRHWCKDGRTPSDHGRDGGEE
ncbi:hypothetical protein BHE74_00035111 [Ensete ventricosum]|nr:hypothetical protein BHE74_00035111 [Ensete ventricosum]